MLEGQKLQIVHLITELMGYGFLIYMFIITVFLNSFYTFLQTKINSQYSQNY